jgi:adenine-specific DNA-methyltransferase
MNESLALFGDQRFGTPKPERLMQRIIHLATQPGDIVLDSFLGSGTTAAVAHKMGRRWIGIEMGEHAATHCKPRLDKVIAGEQGGVSEAVRWSGGGGYRFYRLGDPVFDADGGIKTDIRFPTLAAHVWFSETATPYAGDGSSPVLGTHEGTAYALLYNGILGDRRVTGGNVLTSALLDRLRVDAGGWSGPMVIYGEASRLGAARLKDAGVIFKQTPYDVRAR